MKKLHFIFLLIFAINCYSQDRIGIISEINPIAAHTDVKVGLSLKPTSTNALDLNIVDFIKDYYLDKANQVESYADFNFEQLKNKNPIYYRRSKEIISSLNAYCDSKNIRKLVILKTNDNFENNNITRMYKDFENHYGVVSFAKSDTKLAIYYNLLIIVYDRRTQDFKTSYTDYNHEKNKDVIFEDNSREMKIYFQNLVVDKLKIIIASFL